MRLLWASMCHHMYGQSGGLSILCGQTMATCVGLVSLTSSAFAVRPFDAFRGVAYCLTKSTVGRETSEKRQRSVVFLAANSRAASSCVATTMDTRIGVQKPATNDGFEGSYVFSARGGWLSMCVAAYDRRSTGRVYSSALRSSCVMRLVAMIPFELLSLRATWPGT